MKKYSHIIYVFTILILLLWGLPWAWHFLFDKPGNHPFVLYSCVTRNFVLIDRSGENTVYRGEDGRVYTEKQFDSILPTFYNRQLVADGRFPSHIDGREVDNRMVQAEKFVFRHRPSDVNVKAVGLYPMFEAMSGRVDLEMPKDVFRMNDRLEFVDMASNQVDEVLSQRFTQALLDKGFQFPARNIAGDPNVKKEYDEGYFITDNAWQVYHVKRLKDRPFVRNTGISGVQMEYVFPTTFRNRRFYGFFSDENHRFYVLTAKDYELKTIPIPDFDPAKQSMTILGDPFYWTMQVTSEDSIRIYAIDADDYSVVASTGISLEKGLSEKVADYIFPIQLEFTSKLDSYVYPRFTGFSAWGILLWMALAVGGWMMRSRRKRG